MSRLQAKFTTQHPNIPHGIKDVFDVANHTLQSLLVNQQFITPMPSIPPVTILQRPSVPVVVPVAPAQAIKTENLGALFSEFTKQS